MKQQILYDKELSMLSIGGLSVFWPYKALYAYGFMITFKRHQLVVCTKGMCIRRTSNYPSIVYATPASFRAKESYNDNFMTAFINKLLNS